MRRTGVVVLSLLAAVGFPACFGSGDDSEGATPTPRIGLLRAVAGQNLSPLLDEIRAAGFVEDRNLVIYAKDDDEVHLDPDEAEEVVRGWAEDGLDLVIAFSSSGAMAAKTGAPDADVLFLVNDPTAVGLVANEDRPEGRLTGVTFRVPADRTLDLVQQALPEATALGFLAPADDPAAEPHREAVEVAAAEVGFDLVARTFADEVGITTAMEELSAAEVDAVLVANAPRAVVAMESIEVAARTHRIPLVANTDRAPDAIIVLTPDTDELQAQLGRQAGRLLAGADPSDVPVEDPRRFRVIINAARAAALGITTLSSELLRQADEVKR